MLRKNLEKRILLYVFLLGLFLGVLYTNLFSDTYSMTNGIFSPYFLSEYEKLQIDKSEFLLYLIKIRIKPLLVLLMLMVLDFRKTGTILVIAWFGFLTGVLSVTAVMQLGIKGILLCFIAILPQVLFYTFAYIVLFWSIFAWPKVHWDLPKILFVVLMFGLGILTEVYVNPIVLKWGVKCFC